MANSVSTYNPFYNQDGSKNLYYQENGNLKDSAVREFQKKYGTQYGTYDRGSIVDVNSGRILGQRGQYAPDWYLGKAGAHAGGNTAGSVLTTGQRSSSANPGYSGALLPSSQKNSTAPTGAYKVQSGGDEDISAWLGMAKQYEDKPAPPPTITTPSWMQPSKPKLPALLPPSTSSFNTTNNPAPGGYVSTTVKPSDINANQGAKPQTNNSPLTNAAVAAGTAIPIIGPLVGAAATAYGQSQQQTANPIVPGLPQHQGQLTSMHGQISSPTSSSTNQQSGAHIGSNGGVLLPGGNAGTGTPIPVPGSTGKNGPLGGNTPQPGININAPSLSPLPTMPTAPTSTGGGGGALLPQAPAFKNPYEDLRNEYKEPYRGALLTRMNDEAARQNAAMRDTIRNNYAEQGMGGSGFEKLADFKNDLQMRGQMAGNFNSSLTDMADKSMAFELSKAGGLLAGQGQGFNQYVQGAKLAPEVESLVLGNENTRTQLQFLKDNYQTMLQKERLGLTLTQEEVAQMQFIRQNAPLLAALNAVGTALPGAMRLMGG